MKRDRMVKSLNEWMRRYIEEPERFEAEFRTVIEYLKEVSNGETPSYGENGVSYMEKIDIEL